MSDISSKRLPYHFLRVQLRVVRRKKKEVEPLIAFEVSVDDPRVMESDIIEDDDGRPSLILQANRIKKALKCCGIAGISDLSREFSVFKVHRPKERFPFSPRKARRNYRLYPFWRPLTDKRWHGKERCFIKGKKSGVRAFIFFFPVIPAGTAFVLVCRLLAVYDRVVAR